MNEISTGKTAFNLLPNQGTDPKANRSANLFMWDMTEYPGYKPFVNIVVDGDNIQSMSFSIPEKDMEEIGVHLLKMVKSTRLKK